MTAENLTRCVARFASTLRYEDLPSDVVAMAKRLVLDTLGTSLAATTLGSGCTETVGALVDLGGRGESTIVGHAVKVPAPSAAFANGALAHALNYDAIGPEVGHVGVVSLTAPLAAAEARGAVSGREFLAAVVVAAEVTSRVTAAIARHERQRSQALLRGQFLGYIGAAAGAGRALGLDVEQMHSAFGLALMQSSGSSQIIVGGDPPAKSIYGAFPNHGGVLSALLSRAGVGAACDALEGPAGVYGMITGGAADYDVLRDGLGSEYLLLRTDFKAWPMSAVVHPFVEAALGLVRDGGSAEIESVEVAGPSHMRAWCEPLGERRHPNNAAAAGNSVIFGVAKALAHGRVTLADFTVEGLGDSTAGRIADCTTYRLDDDVEGAVVDVRGKDGSRRVASTARPFTCRAEPITTERLVAKFRDCCGYASTALSAQDVTRIIDTVEHLEDLSDIRWLALMVGGRLIEDSKA